VHDLVGEDLRVPQLVGDLRGEELAQLLPERPGTALAYVR
jgi:hypothetical protein